MVPGAIRLDKWLWQARFFKSRSLCAALIEEGRVRVNGTPIRRPATTVKPGDVLTFPQAGTVRVVRLRAAGERRGPATEAQGLYDDLDAGEGDAAQSASWPLQPGAAWPTCASEI